LPLLTCVPAMPMASATPTLMTAFWQMFSRLSESCESMEAAATAFKLRAGGEEREQSKLGDGQCLSTAHLSSYTPEMWSCALKYSTVSAVRVR
jgi:hypothetical protein